MYKFKNEQQSKYWSDRVGDTIDKMLKASSNDAGLPLTILGVHIISLVKMSDAKLEDVVGFLESLEKSMEGDETDG